jgi:type I restriction enzyme S subunit
MREDWEKCILDDLLVFMTNGSSAKQFDEEVGLPISRIETIWDEKIDFSRVKYIKESVPEFIEKYRICKNDILLSHINSDSHLGKTAIYKNDKKVFIHGINLLKLRPTPRINADFLIHQFRFKKIKGDFIAVAQRAVNQSSINQRKLKVFDFILPSLSEQRAIVAKIEELFSDLDKGIADLKKAQDQLKVYRQAVLKKAFEGELTKEWREQQTDLPTADELLEQIKAERQKDYEQQIENWKHIVKSWEKNGKEGKKPTKPKKLIPYPTINQLGELPILNLGELVFQISRKLMPQEAPNLPFIGMDCLNKNALKPHFTYTFKEFKSAGNWFNENHVLYGRLRPYLNKVYQAEYEGVASGEFIILETIDSIYSNYLKLIIHQQNFVRWSNNQSSGDKPRVKFDQIALYQIKVPSKIEQLQIVQEIESRLSVCDNVGESITESLEKAKALRQSILKKAFEGTLLSVEEIVACKAAKDYEPASVLLEKIKAEKKK